VVAIVGKFDSQQNTTQCSFLNVIVNAVGSYYVTYIVIDAGGNAATQVIRVVKVNDVTAPVITRNGDNPLALDLGEAYAEAGATASDNVDGDISGNITIDASNVNVNVVGSYSVTYNVIDAAGNAATQVIRVVNVNDVTAPVITLVGDNPLELDLGEAYTEAGATATDDVDGDLTIVPFTKQPTAPTGQSPATGYRTAMFAPGMVFYVTAMTG
jgi:hypothetical protein